jgi:hypothetical protein
MDLPYDKVTLEAVVGWTNNTLSTASFKSCPNMTDDTVYVLIAVDVTV